MNNSKTILPFSLRGRQVGDGMGGGRNGCFGGAPILHVFGGKTL